MFSYIYIMFLVCVLFYSIYRDILIYRKGNYKSYPPKGERRNRLFDIFINAILLGGIFFIKDDRMSILLIIFFIFAPIFTIRTFTFNYLKYKETKDKKIIFNTFMYLLIVIIVFMNFLK